MASGDPDIYLVEPTPLTFEIDEENIDQGFIFIFLENIEYETISCDFVGDENIDESVTLDVSTTPSEGQGQQIRKPANVRDSRLGSKSLKTPRMVKQKLTSQLQAARNSFNTIAENQADAMTLMADSLSVIENDQKMM
ncbi:uncharacterized protein LOC132925533 [Rhopalosiphum padi]|uniref:uncharacterized protein LOC132925533 n=1 Tax=Rhopalosiphum padi TaxID=40932 RepID=UPI00298ECEF0|nr:uncharacterized protein LOC132925533 [Rhopalosiphum padi]